MNTRDLMANAIAGMAGIIAAVMLLPRIIMAFYLYYPDASGIVVAAACVMIPGAVGGTVVAITDHGIRRFMARRSAAKVE